MHALRLIVIGIILPVVPLSAQTEPTIFDSILVDEIRIEGNETFDEAELLLKLKTEEAPSGFSIWLYESLSPRFPFAQEPAFFDTQNFRDDIDALGVFYRNNGFFNAKVEGAYEFVDEGDEISVLFTITEGNPSQIDSVVHRNIGDLPPEVRAEIDAGILLRKGRRYRAEDVAAERNRVLRILGNSGFPRATSDSILVERKLSNNNVLVRLAFHHGRRLYFGKVTEEIKGVDELNLARQIVYERLDFRRGEVYSKEAQYEGETSLNRLGVFSYVRVKPDFPPMENTQDTLVPITLELAPRKRFELAPAAILNNQLDDVTLGGELAFFMRNVFGGAQTLTTRVNLIGSGRDFTNRYIASSQLSFEQPYLFSNKNSGTIAGSYSLVGLNDSTQGNILQISIGVRRYFSSRLTGDVTWSYEISEFTGRAQDLLGAGFFGFDTTADFRNSIRGLSLEYDETDDLFNPTRGFSLRGIFEEAGYLENIGLSPLPQQDDASGIRATEYVKLEGLLRHFQDLSANETTILGFKFRLGGIFRYGRSRDEDIPVPPNRRYYAGGPSSIRGWTSRELAADPSAVNFGSNALLEISTELRWHLWPKANNWLDGFWFVTFADAGNLWTEFDKIAVDEAAVAFGIGIRYNLFFGPIRADFGLKMYDPSSSSHKWFYDKRLWGDVVRKGVFQLGIGHAF